MKRTIKFRGTTFQGKVVFGYYVPQCPMSSYPGIVDDYDYIHEVDPDSLAQLVGYDKHGLEVYEGDIVTAGEHCKFIVSISVSRNFLARCTLKETYHEEKIPAPVED